MSHSYLNPRQQKDGETTPLVISWDESTDKYQTYFEVKKIQAQANINELRKSFIGWNPISQRHRVSSVESVFLRQQLGEISE